MCCRYLEIQFAVTAFVHYRLNFFPICDIIFLWYNFEILIQNDFLGGAHAIQIAITWNCVAKKFDGVEFRPFSLFRNMFGIIISLKLYCEWRHSNSNFKTNSFKKKMFDMFALLISDLQLLRKYDKNLKNIRISLFKGLKGLWRHICRQFPAIFNQNRNISGYWGSTYARWNWASESCTELLRPLNIIPDMLLNKYRVADKWKWQKQH